MHDSNAANLTEFEHSCCMTNAGKELRERLSQLGQLTRRYLAGEDSLSEVSQDNTKLSWLK